MGNAFDKEVSLNFSEEELKKLYEKFKQLDKDGSGTLEPHEFFDVPELADNPIVQRVIDVFDKNKDGKISFTEFVQGLSTLHYDSAPEAKLKFAFSIYDMNNDGYISNGDLFKVLKMMVGSNLTDVQIQQLVDRTILQADKDFDGMISYPEFCEMVKSLEIEKKLNFNEI